MPEHVPRLKKADDDGNGTLTKKEFLIALERKDVQKAFAAVETDMKSAEALFDVFDIDGSENLDSAEFVEGVMRSRGAAPNKDMLALRCDIWRVQFRLEDMLWTAREEIRKRLANTEAKFREVKRLILSVEELVLVAQKSGQLHRRRKPNGVKGGPVSNPGAGGSVAMPPETENLRDAASVADALLDEVEESWNQADGDRVEDARELQTKTGDPSWNSDLEQTLDVLSEEDAHLSGRG